MITYRVKGTEKQLRQLQNLQKNVPTEFEGAMLTEGEVVKNDDMVPATPIEFGDLREGLEVTLDAKGSNQFKRQISVRWSAGRKGRSRQYALIVHENPDAFHPVGGWKYIEGPLKRVAPQWSNRVAKRVNLKRAANG